MSSQSVQPFKQFYQQQSIVSIDETALENFARSFTVDHMDSFVQKTAAMQLPLNFSSEAEEINFLSILHLLGVGGMYEHRCSEAMQQSLSDIVLFGIFGAYIANNKLDANFMRSQTASDIGQLFSMPMTQPFELDGEQKSTMSFLTIEKRGGLADLAEMYATVLTDTGEVLRSRGYSDFASLFEQLFSTETTIENLSRELSAIFQTLDDRHFVSVQRTSPSVSFALSPQDSSSSERSEVMSELCFHKNARRLLYAVCAKAATQNPPWPTVPPSQMHVDPTSLAAPSVRGINALLHLGILTKHPLNVLDEDDYNSGGNQSETPQDNKTDLQTLLESIQKKGMGSEVAVRVAAIVACHSLAESIASKLEKSDVVLTPLNLSIFLDSVILGFNIESPVGAVSSDVFIPHESGGKW